MLKNVLFIYFHYYHQNLKKNRITNKLSLRNLLFQIIMRYFFHEFLLSNFVRSFLIYGSDQNIIKDIFSNMMFTLWGYDREQFSYVSNNFVNVCISQSKYNFMI